MLSVTRTGTHTAAWLFSTPVFGISDLAGLDLEGDPALAAAFSGDRLTVNATYAGIVSAGNGWDLVDATVAASSTVYYPAADGVIG